MISQTTEIPQSASPRTWVPILGNWKITENTLRYLPQYDPADPESQAIGLAVCDLTMEDGSAEVVAKVSSEDGCARIVFRGRETVSYYSAGVGGYGYAFVIDRFENARWSAVAVAGSKLNIEPDRQYEISVKVEGQTISLFVDGIRVLKHIDPNPLDGEGLGLLAWKTSEVRFSAFQAAPRRPRAFVVMEFSDELDPIYTEVILPVAEDAGYECYRVDDVKAPGIILDDIRAGIEESTVIVAEVSTGNPNVYYELGAAHALGKKTILLVQQGTPLPFDIRGHRYIPYSDRIRGSRPLQDELRKQLRAVLVRPD